MSKTTRLGWKRNIRAAIKGMGDTCGRPVPVILAALPLWSPGMWLVNGFAG